MESSSLQNEKWKRKRYKEEDGAVPTSPSTPPSSPNRVARAPKCPRSVSLRENRRKRVTWHISENRRLAEVSYRQAVTNKQGPKLPATARRCPMCRQAVTNSGAWLALVWRLALALCRGALPVDIFSFLLVIPGHSFVWTFGAKLPMYKKDTKMGISGIFRSM